MTYAASATPFFLVLDLSNHSTKGLSE